MTEEDIRRQKADALLAHREAKEHAAHVRAKARSIGQGIRKIGEKLEGTPEEFLPASELTDDQGRVLRQLQARSTPSPDVASILDMDRIVALAKEVRDADQAVSDAIKNATTLGVPVY
jgi:hypothetical protein